jgi:excisionase family DNA binding protein
MGTQPRAQEPPVKSKSIPQTEDASVTSEYLTVPETGSYVRHGERSVWRWLAKGLLPYYRVAGGRRVLIKRADVDALLEAGRIEPRSKKAGR